MKSRFVFAAIVSGVVFASSAGGMKASGFAETGKLNLPDWADARINEAVARYRAWKGADETVAFTFMTDVHSAQTNGCDAVDFADSRYHVLFAQVAADRAGCDFLVDAGDHDFDNGCKSPEEALARLASVESVYHGYSARPVLFCLGNHDHGPYPPGGGTRPISSELYGETFNGLAVRHGFTLVFGDNRSWGYYDVPGKRFRAIFCNTSDDCYYGFSRSQIDFVERALATMPDGWTAAVFGHYCLFEEIGHWKHFQQGGRVVNKAEFMKVLQDFAKERPNGLAGVFCGDSHFDNALEFRGVNWTISQGYGGVSPDNLPWGARTVGFDRSCDMLFELVAIKPKTGQFRVFRVGAGGAAFDRTCDHIN